MVGLNLDYLRLPGVGIRKQGVISALTVRSRLYLGKDHLLCVDSQGFSEDYKRFYFRDIQAILIRLSNRRSIWNGVFGGLAMLAGIIALVGLSVPEMVTVFIAGGFVVFFGVCILINIASGPTCITHVRTAVQTEELPSLNRLRRTRKVLARLRPLIIEAQGPITPEEIRIESTAIDRVAPSTAGQTPPVIHANHRRGHYHGRAHLILFWLLLADVPSTLIDALAKSGWTDAIGILLLLVTTIASIIALVKQHHTDMPTALKSIPWIVLACFAVFLLIGIVYGLYLVSHGRSKILEAPLEDPVTVALTVVSTTISLIAGVTGLVGLRKFRSAHSLPPPIGVASAEAINDKS